MPTATVSSARPAVDFKVGMPIPPMTPHAVSVSLPRWQDNVDYEEGRLGDVMQTGYPRFFIHKSIQKVRKEKGIGICGEPSGTREYGLNSRADQASFLCLPRTPARAQPAG